MTARLHRSVSAPISRRAHLVIAVFMLAACVGAAAWSDHWWARLSWAIAALLHALVFLALFRELVPVRLWAARSLRGSPWPRLWSWCAGSVSLTLGPVEVGVHYPASWAPGLRVAYLVVLGLLYVALFAGLGVALARLHTALGGGL